MGVKNEKQVHCQKENPMTTKIDIGIMTFRNKEEAAAFSKKLLAQCEKAARDLGGRI